MGSPSTSAVHQCVAMMGDVVRGKPQQPPTHACEVIYSDIHDLPGLAALLHGHVPGNPAVVDLQGRTLSGPVKALLVLTPGLILKHGSLCLPPKVTINVMGDGIKLQDITITRTVYCTVTSSSPMPCTAHEQARTAIIIQANGVQLELCRVPGLYVAPDSSASLRWCILSGSPSDGLRVNGPGSHVEVQGCDACSNGADGFVAMGKDAVMRFSGRCKAANNNQTGFWAHAGGRMTCSDGCVADGNQHGFLAHQPGSQLIAGRGCRACNNTDIGYQAAEGAKMAVGDGCEACNNGRQGFLSFQPGSQLCLGMGCKTVRNKGEGASAADGGKVVTGQGCVAIRNKRGGFCSFGQDSVMRVGASSRAAHSQAAQSANNFWTAIGGVLEAGEGCQSVSEREGRSITVSGKLGPNLPGKHSVW